MPKMSRFLPDDSRCDGLKVRICSCYSFAGNCITQMLRSLQVLYRLMSVCVNVFVFLLFSVLWVGWFGAWAGGVLGRTSSFLPGDLFARLPNHMIKCMQ